MVEADEYAGNFDAYLPDVVLLTTIEWDHPDVFPDRTAVIDVFERWLRRVPNATLIANVADAGVNELLRRLAGWTGRVVEAADDWQYTTLDQTLMAEASSFDERGTTLELYVPKRLGSVSAHLPTTGWHNVANAAVVVAAALELGAKLDAVIDGLATFPGIGRRLEHKGEARGVVVYDDYGHHPTAIRVTIEAIRQREPGRRVWAVYEPLTYHRTAALLDDFAVALAGADAVAIADIWASRDPDTTITSPGALVEAVGKVRPEIVAEAPGSVEDTAAWLAKHVAAGDAVLVMGGGRSYRIAELLLETLGANRG